MIRATWRSVFARKLRLFLSAFAVILGVAFVAGSYIFTDTLDKAFTGLTSGAVGDVVVQAGSDSGSGGGGGLSARTLPGSLVETLAAVPGAARADGRITDFGTYVVAADGKLIGGVGPPGIAVNHSMGPAANGAEPATLVSGRWPGAGEVVLDPSTAKKSGYRLGDAIAVITSSGRHGILRRVLAGRGERRHVRHRRRAAHLRRWEERVLGDLGHGRPGHLPGRAA